MNSKMNTKNLKFLATLSIAALLAPAIITACAGAPTQELAAPVAVAEPAHIHANLESRSNSKVTGTVHIEPAGDQILVQYHIKGLTKGTKHGFHIHAKGDCSSPDAESAGGHWNPGNAPHGAPGSAAHHPGDFGNITADKKGEAKGELRVAAFKLSDAKGLAVIIHGKADDLKSQPSGNAGPRVACGVLQ